jgi:DNA-binding CsgD family transcriptional regulator
MVAYHDQRGQSRALLCLAMLARRRGQPSAALEHHQAGLAILYRLGDRFFLTNYLDELAGLLVEQGQAASAAFTFGAVEAIRRQIGSVRMPVWRDQYEGDVAAVRAELSADALATAWREGQNAPAEAVLALARALALATKPAPPATPVEAPPEGLTPREAEVIRLLAAGLTDRQIAERLVISPRTVHTHLNAIYAKLGVANRSAATRAAIERGWA